jgi:glyoxylase-like metal-dependent hydrolase (beta-lactamase superfamily II)
VKLALALVLLASTAHAAPDSVSTKTRTIDKLAPDVYLIRHPDAPDTFPQSNTLVVIGTREVLVVDSCYLPSSAKEDIAQIKKWTKKPVRYLVNTHWHYDHTMGNGAYVDAFAGLSIVAHTETQKQIRGYNPQWFAKFPERAARFQKQLDDGKDERGTPLTAASRDELKRAIAGVAPVQREFATIAKRTDMVPTIAFETELSLDLGGREVKLLFLGRGNTAGDIVVYLPKEKLVATGDLVDHPVPYLGGGYPVDEIATLEALLRLDIATVVPGHGKVLAGTDYVKAERELIRAVVAEVDRATHRLGGKGGRNLDAIRAEVLKTVDVAKLRTQFAGTDAENIDFFDSFALAGLIDAAYAQIWPR